MTQKIVFSTPLPSSLQKTRSVISPSLIWPVIVILKIPANTMTEDWCSYDPSSFFRLVPISEELDSSPLSEAAPHLVCHSDDSSTDEAETDYCHHSEQDDYYKSSYTSHTNHEDEDDGMSTYSLESDLSDISEQSSWCADQHRPTSMAGLSSCIHVSFSRDPNDELHSELYSSTLELRDQLLECLPQTEAMVSRAIINVFSVDDDDELSCYSDETCKTSVILQQAYEWARLNHDNDDTQELALSFMQKYIDVVFAQVKNERLASKDAARHLFGIATVLGFEFAAPAPTAEDSVPCTGAEF